MEQGFRFRVMCSDSGLNVDDVAKLLRVTRRTVQNYFSGRVRVPYAAYRLVRIMGRWELPSPEWRGWLFHSGKLWTPEGHGFEPQDSSWWSLLVRQARLFRQMYQRDRALHIALNEAGRPVPTQAGLAPAGAAQAVPHAEGGRRAEPAGLDLSLGHIRTNTPEHTGAGEGKKVSK